MDNSNEEPFNVKIAKSIANIFLTGRQVQHDIIYDIWYDHYEEHLREIYNRSKLQIEYDNFCQYMFDGTKKHTCYRTGLKVPLLI